MATTSFKSLLARFWHSRRNSNAKGFTLIELLVVTLIAGGIVSGLMYLVVELLGSDQRESTRTETQRDMQRSLDYMSAELREAVYVYPGECLSGRSTSTSTDFCPGLINGHLPANMNVNGSVPVLAFWRQKTLPLAVRRECARNARNPVSGIPCLAGHSYALVVYSLNTIQNGTWSGRARITRYELTKFDNNGAAIAGYLDPLDSRIRGNFAAWPYGSSSGSGLTNLQPGQPTGNPQVLTDFVDNGQGAIATNINSSAACPDDPATRTSTGQPLADYSLSPPDDLLSRRQLAGVRSFYACVNIASTSENRDVLIYLRGNASGRPGITNDRTFLPTLSTRVLARGVLGKDPDIQD